MGCCSGALRPTEQFCVLRALWRQRGMLLRSQGRHVQHMQKALTQMNIRLTNVLADIVGESGQKILRAIVAGERDGQVLGAMKNVRVRASVDQIAKSLQGTWRAEHLFALKQALGAFDFVGTQLAECDAQIEQQMLALKVQDGEPAKGLRRSRNFGFLHPNSARSIRLLKVLHLRAAPSAGALPAPTRPAWRCACGQPMHVVRRRMAALQPDAGGRAQSPRLNRPDKPDAGHAHTMH